MHPHEHAYNLCAHTRHTHTRAKIEKGKESYSPTVSRLCWNWARLAHSEDTQKQKEPKLAGSWDTEDASPIGS